MYLLRVSVFSIYLTIFPEYTKCCIGMHVYSQVLKKHSSDGQLHHAGCLNDSCRVDESCTNCGECLKQCIYFDEDDN